MTFILNTLAEHWVLYLLMHLLLLAGQITLWTLAHRRRKDIYWIGLIATLVLALVILFVLMPNFFAPLPTICIAYILMWIYPAMLLFAFLERAFCTNDMPGGKIWRFFFIVGVVCAIGEWINLLVKNVVT